VYQLYPELESLLLQVKVFSSEGESTEEPSQQGDGDAYDDKLWALIDILAKMEGVITVSGCTD
jgi:hypothetical protein